MTDSDDIVRAVNNERLQELCAEAWAWELVIALQDAIIGAPHWRQEGQALLRKIANGTLPEPL
jgi:hypothetical protein